MYVISSAERKAIRTWKVHAFQENAIAYMEWDGTKYV